MYPNDMLLVLAYGLSQHTILSGRHLFSDDKTELMLWKLLIFALPDVSSRFGPSLDQNLWKPFYEIYEGKC